MLTAVELSLVVFWCWRRSAIHEHKVVQPLGLHRILMVTEQAYNSADENVWVD